MSNPIIESVKFRLEDGVTREEFLATVPGSTAFMQDAPCWVARRLSCGEDGTWIEHVEWESLESAEAAADRIMSDERTAAFLRCIHGPSIEMHHTELLVKLN